MKVSLSILSIKEQTILYPFTKICYSVQFLYQNFNISLGSKLQLKKFFFLVCLQYEWLKKEKVRKGKEIYYHICQSFLVAYRSLEYIWIAVVLIELILVIQSQQTLSGRILCTAHFALGPEKPERTKTGP